MRVLRFALPLFLAAPGVARAQDLYDDTTLRTFELTFHQTNWWTLLKDAVDDGDYIKADLLVEGNFMRDVGVRLRGGSSLVFVNGKKLPFKISLDAFVQDQELWGYDAIRLNNSWADPTFLREALMTNTMREYMPLPRINFVVLRINDENWGVYLNEEQKDGRWMSKHFREDTGNRYHLVEGYGLTWKGTEKKKYKKEFNLAKAGTDPFLDVMRLADVLNHTPVGPDLTHALGPFIDLDEALWTFAADTAFVNADTYANNTNNYHLVHDDHHGRLVFIDHDLDLVMGNFGPYLPTYSITYGFHVSSRPLVNRVMQDADTKKEYFAHLRTINEEVFRWDYLGPIAHRWHSLIDAEVKADTKKLYSYNAFVKNVTKTMTINNGKSWGLMPFIEERHAFLATHDLLDVPTVTIDSVTSYPARPGPGQPVTVTARISGAEPASKMELRWRAVGPFQRSPMFADADGVFTADIPGGAAGSEIEYCVVATGATKGANTFFPRKAEGSPLKYGVRFGGIGLRITEYMYSGLGAEFCELTNTTDQPIDLAGWSLDDSSAKPGRFDLSPAGVLAPHASIVVTDADAGAFAADWSLSGVTVLGGNADAKLGRNDVIHVFDGGGRVQDRLAYGDEELPGSPRANEASAQPCGAALGADDVYLWTLAAPGDAQGSWTSAAGDVGSPGQYVAGVVCALGTEPCVSTPNSTGQAATLRAFGSPAVVSNDLELVATSVPAEQFGMLLLSDSSANVPAFGGGQGVLCLGSPLVRFADRLAASGATNEMHLPVDLGALPQELVIQPGETWLWQLWFRDANPAPTSNTTSAVAIQFL